MSEVAGKSWGLLAEFESPGAILAAAQAVRRAGYKRFDVYTPYPVHGMDLAMGLKRSGLGWIVAAGATAGALTAYLLQAYVGWDFPLIHQAKPIQAVQPFVIVIFELSVLFSAFAAVFGMFFLNGLPCWYHPALKSQRFAKVGDNRFYITIETADAKYDAIKTRELLQAMCASAIEELEE
jgi:hypothetical protein